MSTDLFDCLEIDDIFVHIRKYVRTSSYHLFIASLRKHKFFFGYVKLAVP